jgi:hypothetical protein
MSLEGKSVEEIQALAELADRMNADPRTRSTFLNSAKLLNPEANIPEIDIPRNLQAAMAAPLAQLDALTKKQAERDLKDQIESRRRDLRAKGVTEAEIPKLEKLMVEKSIASHDTALEHLRMSERAAEPTSASATPGMRKYERPALPDMKQFALDPKGFTYKAAYDMIDVIRGRSKEAA